MSNRKPTFGQFFKMVSRVNRFSSCYDDFKEMDLNFYIPSKKEYPEVIEAYYKLFVQREFYLIRSSLLSYFN